MKHKRVKLPPSVYYFRCCLIDFTHVGRPLSRCVECGRLCLAVNVFKPSER